MKFLKYGLLVVVVLIAVALLVGMMMPKGWSVERSIVVNAEPAAVHALIGNVESWPKWMPCTEDDPKMVVSFGGQAGAAGSCMLWKSEKLGNGKMRVTSTDPASGMRYELMMEEFDEPGQGSIEYAREGAATRVTWKDTGTFGANPFLRLFGPVMEKMLGSYFDRGLANVKRIVEGGK